MIVYKFDWYRYIYCKVKNVRFNVLKDKDIWWLVFSI